MRQADLCTAGSQQTRGLWRDELRRDNEHPTAASGRNPERVFSGSHAVTDAGVRADRQVALIAERGRGRLESTMAAAHRAASG
jgi:hypothetical protein